MDYTRLVAIAKEYFGLEPSGHDYSHAKRVLDYALKIQKIEGGDYDVVYISSLFHDVHRVLSSDLGHYIKPEDSIDAVKDILKDVDIDEKLLEKVLYIISEHDNKRIDGDKPIELQIIQDADILDALGKIGLTRTLKYCKNYNIPLNNRDFDLDDPDYVPNINPISTVHYVYRTMLPQVELLHTDTARELAKSGVQLLLDFIDSNK